MDILEMHQFLQDLKVNNNRDWFAANKARYELAREWMLGFTNELLPRLSRLEPALNGLQAKDCLFRIYRDVRFSKDKSPYKTQMGAFMAPGGRKSILPGFYLHIEPGASFLGGGVYGPQAAALKAIREEILYNVDEYKSIISDPRFKAVFGAVWGARLKRPPKGFPADFPDIELLKNKSYVSYHPVSDERLMETGFMDYMVEVFEAMSPFNRFLKRAIEGQ